MNPTAQLLEPEVRELILEGRYSELRAILHELPPADVADILSELTPEQAALGFRFLPRDDAGLVFSYFSPEFQEELLAKLGAEASVKVVEAMTPDDRVRLLDELPPEVAQRLIASFSPENRRETQAILGYPARSVGRLMTPDYIAIRPEWTVARSLEHVRKVGRDAETINVLYVVDDQGRLIDDLRLRQVLLSPPEATIDSLMNQSFVHLTADQPQEIAVQLMSRYDRLALPVVDSRGVLVGIVTADDVADVAEQQATEQMQRMGGVQALEEPYIDATIFQLARKRFTWLAVLFVGGMGTQFAMEGFESEIDKAAVLSTFVPMIVSAGGNSGSQATALVIRSLTVGEIALRDWVRVLKRELQVGMLLGAVLGVLGLLRVAVWGWMGWFAKTGADGKITDESARVQDHFALMGMSIGMAVVGVVLWGTIMGAMLPFLLKKIGLDPATSSAPFVATLVDVVGVVIYFTACVMLLRGTLL
ncbi:MAG TPA: magnesium transporter [Phycisphaerales bacterium]|nr:magnesium transporter [Phycisphaerales bacterium]